MERFCSCCNWPVSDDDVLFPFFTGWVCLICWEGLSAYDIRHAIFRNFVAEGQLIRGE